MMTASNEIEKNKRERKMKNTLQEMMQLIISMVEKEGWNVCRIHPSGILGPQDYVYQWRDWSFIE